MAPSARGNCGAALAVALLVLDSCHALAHGGGALLPLRGGSAVAAAASAAPSDLKSMAKHRASQASKAGKPERTGFFRTITRIFFSLTNKLMITGSSTRVVNGRIVMSRNPIQKILHGMYLFIRAIYLFFKTLFVPDTKIEKPKPDLFGNSGGKRGSFTGLSKKGGGITRMADLPPMPGG
ncbi:hypothetical protein T484DRAFT_3040125 [Baffinella frigidus]|nr:hypothetical protein T484DRAFT_3040125 [Cryptophyta sp. CCMP2293]